MSKVLSFVAPSANVILAKLVVPDKYRCSILGQVDRFNVL